MTVPTSLADHMDNDWLLNPLAKHWHIGAMEQDYYKKPYDVSISLVSSVLIVYYYGNSNL